MLPKVKEAAALRLFRAATDAVLYGFLAALWANQFVGAIVEILGRWVCREGLHRGSRRHRRPLMFHVHHGVPLPVLPPAGHYARPRACQVRSQGGGEREGIDTKRS